MRLFTYLFAIAACGLMGCEPDDICLAETPGTPKVSVVFYDHEQPENKKEVPNLNVTGLGVETAFHSGTTDSIAIPLKTNDISTTFNFTKSENNSDFEESLTFKYDSYDVFISRACGYKKAFVNLSAERQNNSVWIKKIEIITDTISVTNSIDVKILH